MEKKRSEYEKGLAEATKSLHERMAEVEKRMRKEMLEKIADDFQMGEEQKAVDSAIKDYFAEHDKKKKKHHKDDDSLAQLSEFDDLNLAQVGSELLTDVDKKKKTKRRIEELEAKREKKEATLKSQASEEAKVIQNL